MYFSTIWQRQANCLNVERAHALCIVVILRAPNTGMDFVRSSSFIASISFSAATMLVDDGINEMQINVVVSEGGGTERCLHKTRSSLSLHYATATAAAAAAISTIISVRRRAYE